jgi:MFS transporter, YNFM family, putative membrane transport protein
MSENSACYGAAPASTISLRSAPTPQERLRVGTPEYRQASWALFLGGFATFSLLYNLQPLMPMLARAFGLTPALASGAVSAATIALAMALIPAAILADRLGRKPVMTAALVLATLFTLVGAFAEGFNGLLVSRALLGLSLAGLPAVAMAYLSEEFEPSAIGRAMGLYISGNALGGLSGRFFAAQIAEHADWRVALICLAAFSALTVTAFWRMLPPSRHFQPSGGAFAGLPGHVREIFADSGLRSLFALGFLLMGCFTSLYNYLGFRLVEAPFSLSAAQIGMVFLLYLVGIVASNLAVRLVDRLGRANTLRAMVGLMVAGLALTLAWQLWLVVLGVGMFTFGFFAGHSVAASWVGRRPVPARALAAALYLCSYYLGASLIGSLSGLAWQFDAWLGVAGCLGAGLALCGLITWRLGRVM